MNWCLTASNSPLKLRFNLIILCYSNADQLNSQVISPKMNGHEDQPRRPDAPPAAPQILFPVIDSQDLLRGNQEVLINHEGNLYRLRLTRSGKLILHK